MRTEVLKLRLARKAQWSCLGLAAAVGMGLIFQPSAAHAIAGACVSCHTMHNSQNGTAMAKDSLGNPDLTANDKLLLGGDCLACHTGTNAFLAATPDTTPYVHDTGAPTYGLGDGGTLAGGSFYWTSAAGFGDAYGHNVVGTGAGLDASTGGGGLVPPGGGTALASQLTCAGTTGCHGDRLVAGDMAAISGSHHGNVNGALFVAGDVGSSYRFLDGIFGVEDPDYETTAADGGTNHNGYYGTARAADNVDDTATISSLCAQCHPGFHNTSGTLGDAGIQGSAWGSPWIRHPTDFDMAAASGAEYADYGGTGVNDYMIEAPLATSSVDGTILGTNVLAAAGGAIVTCISCHRAHGSMYPDALRWDYTLMTVNAGAGAGGGTGCFHCHTAKDA